MHREPTNGELLGARLVCLALAVFSAIAAVAILRETESFTVFVYVFAGAALLLGIVSLAAPKVAWCIGRIIYPG